MVWLGRIRNACMERHPCHHTVTNRTAHPSGYDGVQIMLIVEGQGHEVGIQGSDSLELQADVTGGSEVEESRGGVFGAGSPIDQRGVNLHPHQPHGATGKLQTMSTTFANYC